MSGCVQVQKCGPFPRRRTFWVCTLACAPSLGFFSSSLLVVVCLGKKKRKVLFFDGRCGLLPPPPPEIKL